MATPTEFIPLTESEMFSTDGTLAGNSDEVIVSEKAIKTYADAKAAQAIAVIRNDVPSAGDNLNKIYNLILAINAIIGGATADGNSLVDTVAELLAVFSTYSEGVDIATALGGKINVSAIVNALTETTSGKVLDARQGKALKDLIDALTTTVAGKVPTSRTINGQALTSDITILSNVPNVDATKSIIEVAPDNGSSVLTAGIKKRFKANFPFTITGWNLVSDKGETGSIEWDIWKDSDANYPPTSADSVFGTKPAITSGSRNSASGLTITVASGDWLFFNLVSATTFTEISLQVHITKT